MNHFLENLFPKNYPGVTVRVEDVEPTPEPLPANPMSFGNQFNLIRAVAEHGPLRLEQIDKRLAQISAEAEDLEVERRTLEQLIAIVT